MALLVATWNVNSLRVRIDHLETWLADAKPDVVCLQELKLTEAQYEPFRDRITAAGYPHQLVWGEKTYNGVAMLSRHPIEAPRLGFALGDPDPEARLVVGTVGGVRIYGCYVPNGRRVGSDHFHYKLGWLKRLRDEIDAENQPDGHVLVCGDMNVALDDASVWDPFECEGHVLYHEHERAAIEHLLDWGLTDAFRDVHPFAGTFTWWDYQKMGWERRHGLRIDHVFVSDPLLPLTDDVVIHQDVRGWKQPSDHVPVVAHLDV